MEGTQGNRPAHHSDDDETPLPPPPPDAAAHQLGDAHNDNRVVLNPLVLLSLLYLTITAIISGYRSAGYPPMLAFVIFSYFDLLLLFVCLCRFERLAEDGQPEERTRLKAAIWVLATALMLAFSSRVSEVMPLGLAALIWIMAGTVTLGGFYGLFLYKEKDDKREH